MAAKRVADLVVDPLAGAGVERVYGLTGDSLNGLADAIRRHERMQLVRVRHEETAAFAAGAEAHLTGRSRPRGHDSARARPKARLP